METMQAPGSSAPMAVRSLPPAPPVPAAELATRLANIRTAMEADQVDAIVLSDVINIQYFADFRSLHWKFNSRPAFGLITAQDLFVFGAHHERPFTESKPRSFTARFYDGYVDEGVALVANTIREVFKGRAPRIAIDYGVEMAGRGSLPLVNILTELSTGGALRSASPTIWSVRLIKSAFEANLKRTAFKICNDAFDQTIVHAHLGMAEYELWRMMQAQTFLNGAESGDPFPVIFGKGDFTYGRPASDRRLAEGDYIWADFRATYGGYPADRNRIARAGEPEAWELESYTAVREMTLELCNAVRVGMTCADVHATATKMWGPVSTGQKWLGVKRFGHGGGLDVTEPPSLGADDHTVIRPGMILHVEPKLERGNGVFQFEECIFILEDGIDFLTPLCPKEFPIIR